MFLPMITSLVIAAFMWLRIYSDVFPVNFGVASPLTATSTVMPGIALICLWRDTGLAMVIYNAGLQSGPEELREAAQNRRCKRVADLLEDHLPDACARPLQPALHFGSATA